MNKKIRLSFTKELINNYINSTEAKKKERNLKRSNTTFYKKEKKENDSENMEINNNNYNQIKEDLNKEIDKCSQLRILTEKEKKFFFAIKKNETLVIKKNLHENSNQINIKNQVKFD